MYPSFRCVPRRLAAAWLLALSCWLSLALPAAGAPFDQAHDKPFDQAHNAPSTQHLVRQASLTLNVADLERAVVGLDELARTVRGRFAGDGIQTWVNKVEATLELPPEMLDTALARLRAMALTVSSEEMENRDVGDQVAELNSRLQGLRSSRRQLRELLDQATTNAERFQVETRLSHVEAEIAQAKAALSELRQAVDWAAIQILIYQAPPTPTPRPTLAPTPAPTATPIPVKPSPTPWEPGKTVRRATGVLTFIVQSMVDLTIAVTIVWGPFLGLALVGWWLIGRFRG